MDENVDGDIFPLNLGSELDFLSFRGFLALGFQKIIIFFAILRFFGLGSPKQIEDKNRFIMKILED